MANYDSGVTYDSGITYDGGLPPITQNKQPKTKHNTMKRKRYFPRSVAERPEWFHNFALQLPVANATLGLPAPAVTAKVAEALWLEYVTGPYLTAVRDFGPAASAAVEDALNGPGGAAQVLPVFTAPPLGTVVPQPSGALQRIFEFVQTIKSTPTYTEAIGLQLGIVGEEDAADNPVPTFTVKVEAGESCQCVRITFKKYGHKGVAIYSQRGNGAMELIGIDLESPYLDTRALLVANTPEVRVYQMRFYDDAGPMGDFSVSQSATVGPN
jgi:hypothetical protein